MFDSVLYPSQRLLYGCLPVQVMVKKVNPKYFKNAIVEKDQP